MKHSNDNDADGLFSPSGNHDSCYDIYSRIMILYCFVVLFLCLVGGAVGMAFVVAMLFR